jgi:hypothetical protein
MWRTKSTDAAGLYLKVTRSLSGRSLVLEAISRPLLRNAIICRRSRIVRDTNSVPSKMVPSGQNVTVVPVRAPGRVADDLQLALGLAAVGELHDVALAVAVDLDEDRSDRALTTDTPTPWRPPETL